MRAEELVGRADQEVAAERLHIDWAMRRIVHGIDPQPCAGVMRYLRDTCNRVHRADRVRGVADRHHPRPGVQFGDQIIEAKRAIRGVELDLLDDDPLLGQRQPRRAVGVVIELGDEDLIAGLRPRPMARLKAKVSVVMLGPNAISLGDAAFKKSAMPWCAAASTASLSRLVRKSPP